MGTWFETDRIRENTVAGELREGQILNEDD
jgi:hypothetical protein